MNSLLLFIIRFVHLLILGFITIVPFTNIVPFFIIYLLGVPFMMFHWAFNNDTCSLTILEEQIRKKINGEFKEEECFTCRIIKPFYNYNNDSNKSVFSGLIWLLTLILFLVVLFKMYKFISIGKIRTFNDIFRY